MLLNNAVVKNITMSLFFTVFLRWEVNKRGKV
jgi:hypothetical protein